MAALSIDKQAAVIGLLVEGGSIRSAERLTGVHRDSIMRLVAKVGRGCDRLLSDHIRNVQADRLELDEIWCFVGKKKSSLKPTDDKQRIGDFWTWVALDPDTKLVPHHYIGKRDTFDASRFTRELARRIEGRVQISTDKLGAYRYAIFDAWGRENVDYGRIVKRYRGDLFENTGRYSQPVVVAVEKDVICGDPDVSKISTSHVERQNLTMRMGVRRLTRLTNGFSKKVENLRAAVSLHFAHYNFVRKHSTIKTTPALAAGVANRMWKLTELVEQATTYGR
jgi:IS1 family transposase